MDNVYLKNPECELEPQWFFLEGGIEEAFEFESFESFRERLWNLFQELTSRSQKTDEEQRQLKTTLDKLILLVKGCHYFLHHKKRLNYEEEWIDIKWLKNPYRCLKKYRHQDDEKLNHHLAHFDYNFTQLNREEVQNFTVAFQDFFSQMDLSSWLNLFDDYKECIARNESLYEWTVDDTPLKTYEHLLKLLEACIVAFHWANINYPPPNAHFYLSFFNTTYECYSDANPVKMISMLFYEVSYNEFRKNILELYTTCSACRQGLSMKPSGLRYNLLWLIQAGWIFLQTEYFPEDWLSPNSIEWLQCPIPEKEIKYWQPKNLSIKERKKLAKTLSKLYYGIEVHDKIYAVEDRLIHYLSEQDSVCSNDHNLRTRDWLLKILDILTVILLDFCKGMTKPGGIGYPQLSNTKQEVNIQDTGNESEKL